jgi:4-amino-4-deoxy-L-arabinose transferase-like glycosyltransferase
VTRAHLVALIVGAAMVAAACRGVVATPPERGYDGRAHVEYVEILRGGGRLPTERETYEYSTPPAYPWLAVQAQRVADTVGVLPRWRAGQALSVLWLVGELAVAFALARELAPGRPRLAAAAVAATAAVPIVLRLGVMLHPESQAAALLGLALFLFVRASRRGWPLAAAAAIGVVLGLAAVTRQTAAIVIVAVAAVALCARAFRFAAVAAVALAVVAGPWWGYQGVRYGNPLESNLNRPGYVLHGGLPRSYYVSAPIRALVVHPYRPRFANQLLPQFYADLWSDWFGGQHDAWEHPSHGARIFASMQSVTAFPLTVFAIGAVFGLGVHALRRVVGGRAREIDAALSVFLVVVVASWIAFFVQVTRFPQVGGDPIKSSYMLYLAPVFAVGAVLAGARLWECGRAWRFALAGAAALYAASYVGFVVTSY